MVCLGLEPAGADESTSLFLILQYFVIFVYDTQIVGFS